MNADHITIIIILGKLLAGNIMECYYAHIAGDGRKQSVDDHLCGSAKLCSLFAASFGADKYGHLTGYMHDIGKYSDAFQRRLEGGPKVDHSSAGALECTKNKHLWAGICISGHHGGLPDYGNECDLVGEQTFVGRMRQAMCLHDKNGLNWNGTVPTMLPFTDYDNDKYVLSFWIRMLYSCLVDADFLDTESFMKNGVVDRGNYESVDVLSSKLSAYTSKWDNETSELNSVRNKVRQDCLKASDEERGLFSLTVPTGGGKTISSLTFALNHAVKHGMNRVIYVIPYTSIIEQNAEVFRNILGSENVVEHHSEAQCDNNDEMSEVQKKSSLAAENWDAPIIVTTAVQFFESLYSNKPSKCRKLHNIVNSVVIFDEVQSIPTKHLLPCMAAIGVLIRHFGVSAVLCSATQPLVSDLLSKYSQDSFVREICSDVEGIFSKLERVKYRNIGRTSMESIAEDLKNTTQVLCVVNKRKTAKDIFDLLPNEGSFHLSTLMTPHDRRATLYKIRERLSQNLPCRVVSTSLIEAGVDIDFPSVYREMTGLDSIVQAAGRCNREGNRPLQESFVTVFELADLIPPVMLRMNIGATREAIASSSEIGSKKSIDHYFRAYRSFIGNESIDSLDIVKHMQHGISGCQLPFKTVADSFHLIDNNVITVYIPMKGNEDIIQQIQDGTATRNTYRLAGQYSVNIYEDHYIQLFETGSVTKIADNTAILLDSSLYNNKTGLSFSSKGGNAEFV